MTIDGHVALAARVLGALSLLAVGVIHLHEYQELYSAIPTIGTLFVLSFIGALVVSAGLLSPVDRLPGRWGDLAVVGLALAGIGQATTQFVFLAISEQRPLFGFQEPGYDPPAILASRIAEVATVAFLAAFLITRATRRRASHGPGQRQPHNSTPPGTAHETTIRATHPHTERST
jgi:hypothetical protein